MSVSGNSARGRLIMHVGLHKTGTTTIQHFLYENKALLERHGVLYPFDEVSHWKVVTAAGLLNKDPQRLFSISLWEELRQLSRDRPHEHILLSSEDFSFAASINNRQVVQSFFEKIKGLGRAIDVIIYIRRQDEWVESLYLEELKHVSRVELPDFVELKKGMLNYGRVFSFWQRRLGKGCTVRPIIFEKGQSTGLCFDFLHAIGIEDTAGFKEVESKNHRHTLLTSQMLYGINGKLQDYLISSPISRLFFPLRKIMPLINAFSEEAGRMESTKNFRILPFDMTSRILGCAAPSNRAVAEKWFPERGGVLFRGELAAYEPASLDWPPGMTQDLMLKVSNLWDAILLALDVPHIPFWDDGGARILGSGHEKVKKKGETVFHSVRLDSLPVTAKFHDIPSSFGCLSYLNGTPMREEMPLPEGLVNLEGWAVLPESLRPASAVIAFVNEVPYLAKINASSPEVGKAFSRKSLNKAGFTIILSASAFGEATNSLRFVFCGEHRNILFSTGQQYTLYKAGNP